MKEKMDPTYISMHSMLDPLEALYVSIHAWPSKFVIIYLRQF